MAGEKTEKRVASISVYDRVTIAAEALVPVVRALRRELGDARADALIRAALREEDLASGRKEASRRAPTGTGMEKGLQAYAEGDALDYDVLAADEASLDFDVHRCRYAEFMERIDARDLGGLLICERDFAIADGMGVELSRDKTRMQGDDHCNFRYRVKR